MNSSYVAKFGDIIGLYRGLHGSLVGLPTLTAAIEAWELLVRPFPFSSLRSLRSASLRLQLKRVSSNTDVSTFRAEGRVPGQPKVVEGFEALTEMLGLIAPARRRSLPLSFPSRQDEVAAEYLPALLQRVMQLPIDFESPSNISRLYIVLGWLPLKSLPYRSRFARQHGEEAVAFYVALLGLIYKLPKDLGPFEVRRQSLLSSKSQRTDAVSSSFCSGRNLPAPTAGSANRSRESQLA